MKKVTTVVLAALLAVGISALAFMANMGDKAFATVEYTVGDVDIQPVSSGPYNSELVPGAEAKVTYSIKNIKENDAWVWLTYTVPAALYGDTDAMIVSASFAPDSGWYSKEPAIKKGEDDVLYKEYTFMYNNSLGVNQETPKITLSASVAQSIDRDENGNWISVVNGEVTKFDWNCDSVQVLVSVYGALKTNEVDTVEKAYAAVESLNNTAENTQE